MKFKNTYKDILTKIYDQGIYETNKRTNTVIKVAKNPIFFNIDLSNNILPIAGNRTIWPHIAAAEVAWQTQGTKDPKFILKYAPKLWNKFIEDGELKSAYGYRWHKHFNRDQIELAIKALKNDSTSRQIYISNWDPSSDGLGGPRQPKNIPCPLGFTLNIIDNKLNMSVMLRSSDVYVGLPYDVLAYSLTLDLIAKSLNISKGNISFTLSHAHIYQPHFKVVEENIKGTQTEWKDINIEFKQATYSQVQTYPDVFVKVYKKEKLENFWNPKPEVIE